MPQQGDTQGRVIGYAVYSTELVCSDCCNGSDEARKHFDIGDDQPVQLVYDWQEWEPYELVCGNCGRNLNDLKQPPGPGNNQQTG